MCGSCEYRPWSAGTLHEPSIMDAHSMCFRSELAAVKAAGGVRARYGLPGESYPRAAEWGVVPGEMFTFDIHIPHWDLDHPKRVTALQSMPVGAKHGCCRCTHASEAVGGGNMGVQYGGYVDGSAAAAPRRADRLAVGGLAATPIDNAELFINGSKQHKWLKTAWHLCTHAGACAHTKGSRLDPAS